MATTTPNFGWDIPQSTDLVKDGATAIAALGNDIDTSMVDLKGGTTGQVLSKASNTDMDFTWINNDQGDITEVTAGTGLTGGGTSGAVSLAFDVANYGGGQRAAGKNFVINGGFDIWQRGTSSSATAGGYYTADRYYTAGGGTVTFSQQTDVPTGVVTQYSMRWLTGAATSYGQFYTALDSATIKPLRGQSVVFSYYIKTGGSHSGNILTEVTYSNSTDALTSQTTNVNPTGDTSYAASGVTSWTRKSVTFTVPTDAVGLRLAVVPNATQASGVSELTTGWQLELGSTPTPFSRAGGTIQGELAACQRYYFNGGNIAGFLNTSGNSIFLQNTPVPMRATPSISYSGTASVIFPGTATYTTTTQPAGISITQTNGSVIYMTIAGLGATAASGSVYLDKLLTISAEI